VDAASGAPLLTQPERLERRLKEIPAEPGCYLMRDGDDRILYVGKSKALRSRVRSYFRSRHDLSPRIRLMTRQVCEIEFIVTDSEAEALVLESNLIKNHQPHFNVLLKDDKKYPYLCITWSEAYPRIFITRRRRFRSPLDRFYGPYVDVGPAAPHPVSGEAGVPAAATTPADVPRPHLPQLQHRRCPGVCQEKISSEDYHRTLRKVAMVFQGRSDELQQLLQEQMERYAERMDYESAARVRDQLQGLDQLTADQKMSLPDSSVSRDVLALAFDERLAAVQLFQMRAGKLVGRLGYTA
jgi:excinuclease ABC subunit C